MKDNAAKWIFVINPIAGNNFAGRYADEVQRKIKQFHVNAEIVYTTHKGHATTLTEEYMQKGYNHFIAVGGDGTANEMIRNIVGKKDVIFGVIAAGTENDMIHILGFPGKFTEKDWEIFFQKNIMRMDVGKCNDNYFLNGMGIGFDAKIASENYTDDGEVIENQGSKYLWHILKNMLFYKEKRIDYMIDGNKITETSFMSTISIGRRFAGKYFLTPKAWANDGLLDICLVGKLNIYERFKLFHQVPDGAHLADKKVRYYQTDRVMIHTNEQVPHHLDGEIFFASEFDVSILAQGLNIIYNPSGVHYFKKV